MNRLVLCAASLTLALVSGCTSCDPVDPPVQTPAVGALTVVSADGAATLNLSGVAGSLRSLQVDVAVSGGQASAVDGLGHDLVEAGLAAENGGPKSSFTVVVADTRLLPVNNGNVARLTVDTGATVSLSNAIAIDAAGVQRALTTENK